jgi:DNA-binding NtrC family response regulator
LRERPEDIPDLAKAFLARESAARRPSAHLRRGGPHRLQQHTWPGNVRELENAIVRLGVLVDGPQVTAATSKPRCSAGGPGRPRPASCRRSTCTNSRASRSRKALQRFDGNKPKAAAALGIALKTLYNKLNAAEEDKEPTGSDG